LKPNLAFYADLARELKIRKLTVTDVHALFLNAAQMFSAQARCGVLAAEGQAAQTLGADILVVHPTDILKDEESLDQFAADPHADVPLVNGISSVIRELTKGNVRIALENVQHWRDTRGTNDAELLTRLVEALDCHAALDVRRGLTRPSLDRWIELLGNRIAVLYLYDSANSIERHPPAAQEWREIIPKLQSTSAQVYVLQAAAGSSHGAIKLSRDCISKLLQAEHEQTPD